MSKEPVIANLSTPGFVTEVSMGSYQLISDEPVKDGGDDKGPAPYDLLLAAIGACTAMTLRFYAKKNNIPLDEVKVYLLHDKVYADDCRDCETNETGIDRIERIIEMKGELSTEQKAKLMEIADKCPVHKTLTGTLRIESFLK